MTTPTQPPEYALEDFYASSKPIRRFVAALVAAAAGLVLLWWTGLFAPRLSADALDGRFDAASRTGVLRVALHNDAPTPVRIDQVELLGVTAAHGATLGGQRLGRGAEIPGDGTAVVRLEYGSERCVADQPAGWVGLWIDLRTAAGISRTERLDASVLEEATPASRC